MRLDKLIERLTDMKECAQEHGLDADDVDVVVEINGERADLTLVSFTLCDKETRNFTVSLEHISD